MPTWTFFDSFKKTQLDATLTSTPVNFAAAGDTLKISLVTSILAPNVDTHDNWNDLSTNEVTGTNYTAGGETLASKTVAEATGTVTFDAADVSWTQSGAGFANARYAILYKDSGVASTSPLVCFIDFVTDKGNTTGDLIIQMDAAGIFTLAG